jgi:hypothetical protein
MVLSLSHIYCKGCGATSGPKCLMSLMSAIIYIKGTVSRDRGQDEPKLMFANPFFHLKIRRFKATVHRVAHPSMFVMEETQARHGGDAGL